MHIGQPEIIQKNLLSLNKSKKSQPVSLLADSLSNIS